MNGQAVASLVTGIVSLVFCWGGWLFVATSAIAVVTGIRGGRAAKTGKGQLGVATAGLVIGGPATGVAMAAWAPGAAAPMARAPVAASPATKG